MTLKQLLMGTLSISMLVACGNLSKVSDQGTTDQPVWPAIDISRFNSTGSQYGSWPNRDNIDLIEQGMNKDQIYNLIGRPHFSEGLFDVREWDYVFNFRENGVHKICQFKVLYDKNLDAQSFFWKPENCANSYEFSDDFLFEFDADQLTSQGRQRLSRVAAKLKAQHISQIHIAGYTDPLGSEAYNQNLSQRRANSVKQYLADSGIPAQQITAVGYGKTEQVKICKEVVGLPLKDCLAPNRRVVISAQ